MSGFQSSHEWSNGSIVAVQELSDSDISVRLQGEGEAMIADVVITKNVALSLAHSILSVLTRSDGTRIDTEEGANHE